MFWGKKEEKVIVDEAKIEELLTRGVDEVIDRESLKKKLLSGKKLRIKLGIDPTSPNLHLGRSVPILKMKDFQDLGHQVILLVGDFTGVIGDTSDKDAERPMIDQKTIDENKKTYFSQIGKIIDLKKAEQRQNSEWLTPLNYNDVGEHANIFSVNQFIQRENIKKRLDEGKRVSLREVLYPLMQGYDSVALNADVELGGTDQRFNLLAGRELQRFYKKPEQDIVMSPLVEGTDGRKMSSSWGNTINFNDTPENMFGGIMKVNDELIIKYFTLLTRVPMTNVLQYEKELKDGTNPKDIKMKLAFEIVSMYHSIDSAQKAYDNFVKTFSEGQMPDEITEVVAGKGDMLADILVEHKVVESKTEYKRLVKAGAITNIDNDKKIDSVEFVLDEASTFKVGKRRFIRVLVEEGGK